MLEGNATRRFAPALAVGLDAIADLRRPIRRGAPTAEIESRTRKSGAELSPVERFFRALAGDSL